MKNEKQFYIVDLFGQLVTETGETEREAYRTLRYFEQELGDRHQRVVHFRDLSATDQAKLNAFDEEVARLTAQMRGPRAA